MAQNSLAELAHFFGATERTILTHIRNNFNQTWLEYAKEKRGKGNAGVRLKQFKEALSGNNRMLELWGKLYLGQAEVHQEKPKNDDFNDIKHENMLLRAELEKLRIENGKETEQTSVDKQFDHESFQGADPTF